MANIPIKVVTKANSLLNFIKKILFLFYQLLSKYIIFVPMKQQLYLLVSLILLAGCGSKSHQTSESTEESATDNNEYVSDYSPTIDFETDNSTEDTSDTDEVICKAIVDYLNGDDDAVRFMERTKEDLYESTWPEVYCSVEGVLDSPAAFKDLVVKKVGPGQFKYECVCPDHGDRYVDNWTISAYIARDGVVEIEEIKLDATVDSFADLLDKAEWYNTEYGFRVPKFMTPSSDIWVDDAPGSVVRWDYNDICLSCWPMLGAWAVTDYPEVDSYLTEAVKVKCVTNRNNEGSLISGDTDDGRIWYMKKQMIEGRETLHAKVLILIYPGTMQPDVGKLIDVVKGW